MSRRPGASDEALIELFLDMLAAERGAGENTLAAYRNDLEDLSAHLRASRSTIANTTTDNLRKFLASLAERGSVTFFHLLFGPSAGGSSNEHMAKFKIGQIYLFAFDRPVGDHHRAGGR